MARSIIRSRAKKTIKELFGKIYCTIGYYTTSHYKAFIHAHRKKERGNTMAENIIATWRTPGVFKADAQKVCDELHEIGEEFTPEDIVEAAEDEDKELHKCFEWNDTKAAHKYRIHQAVILTSQLVFRRDIPDKEPPPAPVRIFSKTDSAGGYKIPERTFKVQEEYEALLQRALAELHAFKVKYSALKELDYILELID